MMTTVIRPGIDPRWTKSWNRDCKRILAWYAEFEPASRIPLEKYVDEGIVPFNKLHGYGEATPPLRSWEGHLRRELAFRALLKLGDFEVTAMRSDVLNVTSGAEVFAYAYFSQLLTIQRHHQSIQRRGRQVRDLDLRDVMFTALGGALGCHEHMIRLAKLQIQLYQKRMYQGFSFPIFHFIVHLLNDYLGGAALYEDYFFPPDGIHQPLLSVWRSPDPKAIVELCLAACDYHTRASRDGAGLDFDEGDWTRTPAHILLLFRLRETLGLKNPELEHPLFYSCFDTLAPHAQFAPDELLVRVLAQMKRDGFDEDEICASEMP